MGLLDGELAQIVGSALVGAGMSKPTTLTRVTPTARDPAHPTTKTAPTTVDFPCQGFVARLEPYLIRGTLIANVTRVVKIYGSTLASGVVPAPGDRVTIEGLTSVIVPDDGGKRAVQRDPAGAVYTLQCA